MRSPSVRLRSLCLAVVLLGGNSSDMFAQHPLAGQWVGGYQLGRNYVYVTLNFTVRGDTLSGTAHVPFQLRQRAPLRDLRWTGSEALFSLEERDGTHRVQLRPGGDQLRGTVAVGARSLPFEMVRVVGSPGTELEFAL